MEPCYSSLLRRPQYSWGHVTMTLLSALDKEGRMRIGDPTCKCSSGQLYGSPVWHHCPGLILDDGQ